MLLKKANDHMHSNLIHEIILIQNKKADHTFIKILPKTNFKILAQI